MTHWSVFLTSAAAKEIRRLSSADQRRIAGAIELLTQHPFPPKARKIIGRQAWRVRVGDYRIIYTVSSSDVTITVIRIGHGSDAYRT